MTTEYQHLLTQLGEKLGMPKLEPDEMGAVQLVFDETVRVIIQCDEDSRYVSLYSVVAVKEEVDEDLLMDLLTSSLFGSRTNGASFGLEQSTGQVVLQRQERLAGLSLSEFEILIEDFVDAADAWRQRLSGESPEDVPKPIQSGKSSDVIRV